MRKVFLAIFALSFTLSSVADIRQINNPVFHWDNPYTGEPGAGYFIYFYEPNTTSTPKTVYSDIEGATTTNPVELDSYGNAKIWGNGMYKVVIKDDNGVTWETMDDVVVSATETVYSSELLSATDAANARSILGLGSASTMNGGTGASNLLQLTAEGAIPAVSGEYITGLTEDQTRVLPYGYIGGLCLSNVAAASTTQIRIGRGACRDATDTIDIRLTSSIIKKLDASWSAGTNQGGNQSGSSANPSSTYHVFLIKKGTDTVDAMFSTSVSPTLPIDYGYYRRIGSVLTDSVGAIISFHQFGDEFILDAPVVDINPDSSYNLSDSATTLTLTNIPSGIEVKANLEGYAFLATNDANVGVRIFSPSVSDINPPPTTLAMRGGTSAYWIYNPDTVYSASIYSSPGQSVAHGILSVLTNTSKQIKAIGSHSQTCFTGLVLGWIDRRGQDDE